MTTFAEVWCRFCEREATGPDALCSEHRATTCADCGEPITTIIEWREVVEDPNLVSRPFHAECAPRLIEEYPDDTVRRNGPIIVGDPCPWCGGMVLDSDH